MIDKIINQFDSFIRIINNVNVNNTKFNDYNTIHNDNELTIAEQKHSAALMRINHVGEVCAQALYKGQQVFAKDNKVKIFLAKSEQEELQHLNWCYDRIIQLNSHTSHLNSFWYASSFAIGMLASKINDSTSLAFVVETEQQVSKHLHSHIDLLPKNDIISINIVKKMKMEEQEHAAMAIQLGASILPAPIKFVMKFMAKIMTKTAYYI